MLDNTKDIEGVLCISTGALNDQLPCVMQAKEIENWGVKPHAKIKAGLYWRVEDVPELLEILIKKINDVRSNACRRGGE